MAPAARLTWCVLLWVLPVAATWTIHALTGSDEPDRPVNMFGMTPEQHGATLAALGVSVVAVIVLCVALRLGFAWLLVAVLGAVALAFALNLVNDHLVGVPAPVASAIVLLGPPILGALTTRSRGTAQSESAR